MKCCSERPATCRLEQIAGKPLDGRADQFALGVIAYELITGEKPFVSESVASLLFKIVHEGAQRRQPLESHRRPGCPVTSLPGR